VSEAPVNWCPGLGTVVANEEVTADGRSDRGNFPVFKRSMRQWMMRITTYADRLIDDLELLDWTDAIKTMQRNWIGRSHGAEVHFPSPAGEITVFTTRPDTLFGASFMVLSPEHPFVDALTVTDQADAVRPTAPPAAKKDIERQDETREKTGVFTGSYATNPVNGEQIPVWIADYVLMGYGTGAIMAVPCGDQRDFEFARKFDLPIPAIQQPPAEMVRGARRRADARHVAVAGRLRRRRAVRAIGERRARPERRRQQGRRRRTDERLARAHGAGTATVNYKLRDWLFSRQRYWGEPFPIVYDVDGRPHTLPDDMLPVLLPETESFSPRTFDADDEFSDPESPSTAWATGSRSSSISGDGPQVYRRDTNVMPQWAGSCWYEMRYLDPTNENRFVDREVEEYWMGPRTDVRPDHPGGVDLYVGGVEHAVLHLLYSRFWHKVLYDLGHVSSKEPYARLFNQGYVQAAAYKDEREIYVDATNIEGDARSGFTYEGKPVTREWGKMGKSLKNAVSPDDMYEQYGADTLRLYEMATGPLDASRPWETRDVVGMYRFLQRLWRNMVDEETGECTVVDSARRRRHPQAAPPHDRHRSHRDGRAAVQHGDRQADRTEQCVTKLAATPRDVAEPMVIMLSPLVPHIAEELWRRLGHDDTITYVAFPEADPALLVDDTIEVPVQVNGKVRGRIEVAADADAATIEATALADDKIAAVVDGMTPKKVIVVPAAWSTSSSDASSSSVAPVLVNNLRRRCGVFTGRDECPLPFRGDGATMMSGPMR
jgi:leucyl-tRNA synthetase